MMKPGFSNVILFFLLVNIGCDAQSADQSKIQTGKVFIEVKFATEGHLIFNYLDSNFQNATIRFKNAIERDTSISKNLHINGPTVLTVVENEGNKLFKRSFLALPGDSLLIKLDNHNHAYLVEGTNALDLSNIFDKQDFMLSEREYSLGSLNFLLDSVKKIYLHNESKIKQLSLKQKRVENRMQVLKWYNKLLFYSNLFKVNYETYTPDSIIANKEINKIKTDAISDAYIFTKIYTKLTKAIIHSLTQREARISNSPSSDIFINLKYLDREYQKKKYFDGYFHDLLLNNENIVTTTQRSNIVNKHKGFMFDTTSFITKPAFNKLPIPIGVMDATVRELNGSDKEIKNLISSANGKVILIDFWASWCAPCITEMPYLKKAGKKFKDKVTIFSISIDSDVSNWKKAVKKYNLFLNSFLIEDFENHQIVKYLQLNTIPRIILINSKGELLESDFLKPSNKNFEIILEDIITQQQ